MRLKLGFPDSPESVGLIHMSKAIAPGATQLEVALTRLAE
jgi:hypothetical protein